MLKTEPHTKTELVARLIGWLKAEFPRDIVMPMTANKEPCFAHRGGAWTWERLLESVLDKSAAPFEHVGILLRDLCVVDFDDEATALSFEAEFPEELLSAPCEMTRKGRHYFFVRPPFADEEGFYDGARQRGAGLDVDFKSVCATGTSGTIVVAPSAGKAWVRPPWECARPRPISRALLERIAVPRSKKRARRVVESNSKEIQIDSKEIQIDSKEVGRIEDSDEVKVDISRESSERESAARLVGLLSASRARSYGTWIQVGLCLHNIDSSLLGAWIAFSRRCPDKYVPGECEAIWSGMRDLEDSSSKLGLGSLRMWAREDSPEGYLKAFEDDKAVVAAADKQPQLLEPASQGPVVTGG